MAPSPPIDIKPASRHASASPQNRSSNLSSAFQQAGVDGMDIYAERDGASGVRNDSLGVPGSLGVPRTAARPISTAGARRGSNTAGSFMGGMSFGGMSMSSWVQDDIMMTGTSPFGANPLQSPSFHSSSYLPKKEADFWSNLRCCEHEFNDLHDLLQHYEDVHRDAATSFPTNRMSTPGRGGFFRRKSSGFNQSRAFNAAAHGAAASNGQQQVADGYRGGFADMDTIGEMEMDFGDTNPFANQDTSVADNARMRPGPINPRLANAQQMSTPHSSNPSTPATARQTSGINNPMVSQGNTPSFTTGATATSSGLNTAMPMTSTAFTNDTSMLTALDQDFSNMDFSNINPFNNTANNDFLELTINDPARALFSENGGINAAHAQLFGFVNGANTNPDNQGGAMQPAQMRSNDASAELPPVDPYGGEDRPFKCLVVGCEKAYKNANGLRYHERHGHASQQLTKNSDGTLSIVDPSTGEAFPGTVGMEKEKPYRCEACGKRYKNLNGLKYHKNHSPPCNPDLDVSKVSLPDMGGRRDLENAGMDAGVGLGASGLGGMGGMGSMGLGGSREGIVGAGGGWQS